MKHLLSIIGSAFAGATVGYVAHQLMQRQSNPDGPRELIVGAPPFTALVAALIGIIFGRSNASAFLAGAAITASVGDKLDMAMPAIASAKRKLIDKAHQPSSS
jgi:Kef-type K+ transport system membrane component KefB